MNALIAVGPLAGVTETNHTLPLALGIAGAATATSLTCRAPP